MSSLDRIADSGWGALFLYLYSAVLLFWLRTQSLLPIQSDRFIILVAAVLPPAALVFLASIFNDELMELFVGDTIRESYKEINRRTGDDGFYQDADSETQESINERDQKAHKHLVTVLTGLVIAVTLPIVVYLFVGLSEGLIAIVGSILVVYTFCYRRYRDLQQVVKSSIRLYDVKDED